MLGAWWWWCLVIRGVGGWKGYARRVELCARNCV